MSTGDRVVVVTGGSAGVGRATVREFAAAGYRVGVVARGSAGLDAAVADVERAGSQGLTLAPNLYTPSDDTQDLGAHGSFDDQAHGRDPLLWTSMHRGSLLSATVGAGIATAGTVAGLLARRR